MKLEEFKASLSDDEPPEGISPVLQALWEDGKGNWDRAHQIAQSIAGAPGAWVHAYLHRKEGDFSNASYWYSRADRPRATTTLEKEWEQIVSEFLIA